jgi:uncharacterized protein YciI
MARTPAATKKAAAPKKAPANTADTPRPPTPVKLFAVTLSRGPGWVSGLPMEQQADWVAHAALMDALEADGFIFIGGPLDDTHYVMLACRADTPQEVRTRLEADPWHDARLLEITRIAPWTLRMGAGKV